MVYHCPTLNLSTLSITEIDLVVSTFDVTWHSVLLLTSRQYQGQKATLVVTLGGKTMLIRRPLTTVLKEFFEENCIGEAENRVYYQMIDRVHATRAAVSGRYQLVPSCGTANEDVVWVMTHHLIKASCPNKRENDLLLQFQTDQTEVPLIVQIHSCGKSFLANMRTAD